MAALLSAVSAIMSTHAEISKSMKVPTLVYVGGIFDSIAGNVEDSKRFGQSWSTAPYFSVQVIAFSVIALA